MSSSSLPLWPEADSSFVGKSIHLEGFLRFSGDFLLDGNFTGEIEGSGRLEIGASAQASGKIVADELIHYGRTEGDLIAVKKLNLRPGCLHRGDIQALRVRVSSHARLEGVLKMPNSSPAPAPNSSFYRYRSHFTVGIIVLFLAGAGATTAISNLPKIWHSVEGPVKRIASLAQSFPRRSASQMPSAGINQRQDSFLEEALLREREGNFSESLVLLNKAINLGGRKSRLARFRLAKNLAQLGRYKDATACLKELLREAPGHIGGMILLGDLHARAGHFQKAAFAYAEAVRHDPVDLVLRRRLERVHARTGGKRPDSGRKSTPSLDRILDDVERLLGEKNPVQAAKVIRNGLARLPNEPRLYFQLGSALRQISDRQGAIDAYKRVISLAPDWLDAYTRLGALLEASQRYKEAVVLYKRAADLHPSNLDMLVQIPLLEKRRGHRDKAYRLLLKMQKDYPKSTVVLVELGMLLWEIGKASEARSVFRRVLGLDPHSSPALNRLAWFHVMDGKNLELGIEYSKRSLEIRPDIPPYLDTLAELYYRSGQPVKSIPLIHRAIELEPSNRYYRVQLNKFKRAMR